MGKQLKMTLLFEKTFFCQNENVYSRMFLSTVGYCHCISGVSERGIDQWFFISTVVKEN